MDAFLEYEWDFDFYSDDDAVSLKPTLTETALDYSRLKEFLYSPVYKHYSSFIRFANGDADVPVEKFMFLVTFHHTESWDQRVFWQA